MKDTGTAPPMLAFPIRQTASPLPDTFTSEADQFSANTGRNRRKPSRNSRMVGSRRATQLNIPTARSNCSAEPRWTLSSVAASSCRRSKSKPYCTNMPTRPMSQ
uniref:(northern house mosquito) hypothetical protein n=1 Tax=Culex pipiens TaxID=7175 RepID=A0A8D8BUZ2_CULPI